MRVITRMNVGGPALHVAELTKGLDASRFESVLVTGVPGPEEGDMLELRPDLRNDLGDRLVVLAEMKRDPRPWDDARALLRLTRLIADYEPDIVDTHLAKAGTLARLAARRGRTPKTVHTFHGTSFSGHFREPVGSVTAAWERLLARRTDLVIAVSDAVAADLRDRGVAPSHLEVVPLGLDLTAFDAVEPLSSPTPAIVTLIARVAPVKDVPLFIQAVASARRSRPDLVARIVGDGPSRAALESTSPPWVEWLGNRSDLPSLLADTGMVALTSRSEGSPVALIEALAAARPVVAVPVGGVVDLLRDRPGAILTSSRQPEEIGRAVVSALQDGSIAEAAAGGRADILREFGVERLIQRMEHVYETLVDRKEDK